jgi:alpha-1,2-mannosyltransferase
LGGGIEVAWTAQALFALLAAGTVMWTWRKCPAMDLRSAALVTGIAMTTPYIFDYDLTLLALPIAWLGARGIREGFLPWEKMVLCSAWLLPILSRPMGKYLHLPLAPLAIALLLGAVLRRAAIRSEPLEPLQPSHPA